MKYLKNNCHSDHSEESPCINTGDSTRGFLAVLGMTIVIYLLSASNCSAQQDALYSQYMYNQFSLNPAYAGSRQAVSAVLVYRNQWVGFNGAPVSETFSIHSPLNAKRVALGLNVINDQIGPTNNMGAFGTYAYHLPTGGGKLSMALRGGVYRYQMDVEKLNYKDKTDDKYENLPPGKFIPSFDFGMYYYTNTFYSGVSVTHLTGQKLGYSDTTYVRTRLSRHFIAVVGKAFLINDNLVVKPSTMVRYTGGAPVNVDLNVNFLFNKVFWVGASYRTSNDLILIAEFNITHYLRAGYSYDLTLGRIQKYNSGSHEIFIGFDFDISKSKTISPRYL